MHTIHQMERNQFTQPWSNASIKTNLRHAKYGIKYAQAATIRNSRGELINTYIVFERKNGNYVIEQHPDGHGGPSEAFWAQYCRLPV